MLIKNGSISHDPKMGTFTLLGSTGKPHVVRVFPSEYCSCPSTTLCYHIIAVKLSLGIPVNNEHKKVNLTQLRWNTRGPKNQKKAGRKRPRPGIIKHMHQSFICIILIGDYDISPAPDSLCKSQIPDLDINTSVKVQYL